MKIKSDLTLSKLSIIIGVLFMLAFLSPKLSLDSSAGPFYLFFCSSWVLVGLYKIESFILTNESITKTNFCSIINNTYQLDKIVSFEKRYHENDFSINPYTILKLYNKNEKYFKFHSTKFKSKDGSCFTIDERFINHHNLPKLLKVLKAKAKDNKRK